MSADLGPLVRCEGSGYSTHNNGRGVGICKMCGQVVKTEQDGDATVHQRLDVLAVLDEEA